MFAVVLTDGNKINIDATDVQWNEKSRTISFWNGRVVIARINMDNVVGWTREKDERKG